MVTCWVIVPTVIAAIIALSIADLAALVLAGLAIGAAVALGPASWAAASRTTTALRAELSCRTLYLESVLPGHKRGGCSSPASEPAAG
jgi:hypothetical protein